MKNAKNGISLIVLIITIIVMIILAGSVIIALNSSGIINNANNAADSVEVSNELLAIEQAKALAYKSSNGEKITVEQLQAAFDTTVETGAITVMDNEDTMLLKFNESNRYYEIDNTGKVEYKGNIKPKILTIQSVDSTGKLLEENRYTVATKKYCILPEQIADYECATEKIEGIIQEDITIQQLYYKIFDDDTELVFTGLDENGSITTDRASAVSYMVGDGTATSGNGLLEKTVQGILKVPEMYCGKPVTQIGVNSLFWCTNIIKVLTGDNIETINKAFLYCYGLEEIIIGKNVKNVSGGAFNYCKNLKTLTITTENTGLVFNWFEGNSKFTEIKVNNDNKTYMVNDNILYSIDGKIMYRVPTGRAGTLIIPDGVETIVKQAANYTNIEKVVISDTVTTIHNGAFMYSYKLEEIIIGKNLDVVEDHVFGYDKALKTVTINSEKIINMMGRMFTGCNNFTDIKVNNDNKTYMVKNNILYSLDEKTIHLVPVGREGFLDIPLGTEKIAEGATRNCNNLEEIIIPSTLQEILSNNTSNFKTVIIDSAGIASLLTKQTSCSGLVKSAELVYIKEGLTPGSYITNKDNYTEITTDKEGYVKYVKKGS